MRRLAPRCSSPAVRALGIALLAFIAQSSGGRAWADGAFPDSQNLMTPADEPGRVVVATNFGLIASRDDGTSWTWTCEQTNTNFATLYQLGPAPRRRLFAIGDKGLAYSDDGGCSWGLASGLADGSAVLDAFPDPVDANRVFVVSAVGDDKGGTYSVVVSLDGGAHLSKHIFDVQGGDVVVGVESSRSQPATIYVALSRTAAQGGFTPALLRSDDSGVTWKTLAMDGLPTTGTVRIIAVDPSDPNKVLMRGHTDAGEYLGRTVDGGAHAQAALQLPGGLLTSFARMSNGHLFLGGIVDVTPVLYVSTDAGASWTARATPPHLRALSARAGRLYGATDRTIEEYALAQSDDEGATWAPLMDYADVRAIAACAQVACAAGCQNEVDRSIWSDDVCSAVDPGGTGGGSTSTTGGAGGSPGGTSGSAGGKQAEGCGCDASGPASTPVAGALGLVLLAWLRRRDLAHRAPKSGKRR